MEGFNNVFAVGDATNVKETKLGYLAASQVSFELPPALAALHEQILPCFRVIKRRSQLCPLSRYSCVSQARVTARNVKALLEHGSKAELATYQPFGGFEVCFHALEPAQRMLQ